MDDPSFTIKEFCAREKISRTELYKLWRLGQGPRFYLVGTHRRITPEARRQWQQAREPRA